MQRYRSGHNGADSKSVCGQRHVGSNPTRCANSEIPTSVPFPPWGENCTLVGIFLLSGRTRCAGSRPDFEADIRFASSGYVGARSAPLHFQAAFFRGRLKIAFPSLPNRTRWAGLGFGWGCVPAETRFWYPSAKSRPYEKVCFCFACITPEVHYAGCFGISGRPGPS